MRTGRKVGITDLKNHLSACLREVRRGCRSLVMDRGKVIAEIRRPESAGGPRSRLLAEWAAAGKVILPTRRKRPLPKSPVSLPEGTTRRILDELRGP
jgi:antitoxin (DNA-binding transcriptional repressor) of toxin-antitoxin stability system